ncbi:MAG: PAS domain-containing protein [Rhodobacteraceae bacterium]|nr:PAS domain-containing protein [Paracoccaceae bacterium]
MQAANDALRESRSQLAQAQSIAHIGSYILNPITGETSWSEELYRLRGRDPRLGAPTMEEIIETIHPEDRERVHTSLRRSFEEGGQFEEEYRGILADGTERHFISTAYTDKDDRGRVHRFIGTLQDITERKQAEMALRESEERFRQLAESINQVFWMVDLPTEQLLYISPAYERIWGRKIAALQASPQDWIDGVHPEDRARGLELLPPTARNRPFG